MIKTLALNGKALLTNNKELGWESSISPYTIRLRFTEGYTPTFSKGIGVQLSESPNIWNLTYANSNWSSLLFNQPNLIEVLSANTTGITDMSGMFDSCSSLISISLLDTSKVTNTRFMFYRCRSLISIPLLDTSKVTDMAYMFDECESLTTVPLFDTSNVTNMDNTFDYCRSLISIPLLDTSNVTNMNSMFQNCRSLISIPLFNTSKATNMNRMFRRCYKVQSGALALYQQASTQAIPPSSHISTFNECGINTVEGSTELAQIPSDWK